MLEFKNNKHNSLQSLFKASQDTQRPSLKCLSGIQV